MVSAYEQVTRQKLEGLQEDVKSLQTQFAEFDKKTTEMFNHMSNRLPSWATALVAGLFSVISGVAVYAFTHG